jgi:PAS domain S-box-containing protein
MRIVMPVANILQTSREVPWTPVIVVGLILLAVMVVGFLLLRRFFSETRTANETKMDSAPRTENPSAFMAASMQAVIQKLREQEKELERLHQQEKERAEQTERLSEEVTRNMPAGLLVVNANGIISSANPASEQTLGIRGLAFRRYSEALGEKSDLTRLVANCLATGQIFRREQVEYAGPDGEKRQLGVTISPIRRGEEKVSGAICLLSDLTELAALQQQVQLKENLAALGELSAGIAHEFKNALATISGYAQMMKAEATTPDASDNAERILEQTQNITRVVTEFLKYARPLEIPDEPVALQPLIERVVSEIGDAMPQIRIRCEGSFQEVAGDESLLRQAFLNLARNAAEACAEAANGGRVLLRGEAVRAESSGLQRVTVFDNGPGVPQAVASRLFRPFFTTKPKGTGLGLAVVQKIIVQHGGHVEAKNRTEGGAAFIVTLPVCRKTGEAVESKQVAI